MIKAIQRLFFNYKAIEVNKRQIMKHIVAAALILLPNVYISVLKSYILVPFIRLLAQ